ncbi:MAG: amino acid permease, partial [Peptostreptococcaceae bacterium]
PDFSKVNTLVVFVSFILAYMGVEASASHVNELDNAKKNYPLAMIILVVLAIVLNTIGGLTVAAVVPQSDLSLSAGVVETFKALILHFAPHSTWLVKLIAILLALGVMGEVSAWVVGPSRGMYAAAQKGILPKALTKTNEHDVPVNLVFVQGVIVTIWAAVLTFGGGGNNVSFLTAISLTVVIYLVGYLLFFIGYFNLVLKKSDLKRSYQVPGGKVFKLIVAACGFITSIFALVISFFPPSQLKGDSIHQYITILSVSFVVTVLIPFVIYSITSKNRNSEKVSNK